AALRAEIRTVVWASSAAVYGNTTKLPNVETMLPLCPFSPYAASKAAGEMFARAYHEMYGMRIIGLRYFNVYGERQNLLSSYAAVIPLFINTLIRGKRVTIWGDGEQTRDFVHVTDVVQANLKAAESRPSAGGRVYNIGSGVRISVNELFKLLAAEIGNARPPRLAPGLIGEVRHSVADIWAAGEFEYKPTVDLVDGLRQTIRWFQERMREEKT
ncbi:NAD-dependent epimerase/dehydratase family protein, partial [Candidatus Latescibacterota bacterium]